METADLEIEIAELKARRAALQQEIRHSFNDFSDALEPAEMVRASLAKLAGDHRVQHDVLRLAVHVGVEVLLARWLGKKSASKRLIAHLAADQISRGLLSNGLSQVLDRISDSLDSSKKNHQNG